MRLWPAMAVLQELVYLRVVLALVAVVTSMLVAVRELRAGSDGDARATRNCVVLVVVAVVANSGGSEWELHHARQEG